MKVQKEYQLLRRNGCDLELFATFQIISEDDWAIYCMQRGGTGKYFSSYEHMSDYVQYRWGYDAWRDFEDLRIPKCSSVLESATRNEWYPIPAKIIQSWSCNKNELNELDLHTLKYIKDLVAKHDILETVRRKCSFSEINMYAWTKGDIFKKLTMLIERVEANASDGD